MRPYGIYVQVPFCQTKCTYCNFHTGVVDRARFAPYVRALCREIREHRTFYEAAGVSPDEAPADTVYLGGGTPSLLDPAHLAEILGAIRDTFGDRAVEVTLEADPETVAEEKAARWQNAGINRISFGVQSFVDQELAAAGRLHRRADVYRAVRILRGAGIRQISFDLIAGLAKQTAPSWDESLEALVALDPEHVSIYLLEIDEGSRLGLEILGGGGRYSAALVPDEDQMAEFYDTARRVLSLAGYHHYEISNFAKPGLESRHNLKYWRREPYLGFGAGAHSFSGRERWANAHDAAAYVRAVEGGRLPIEQHEEVSPQQALEEQLFLGLRQLDGIDVAGILEGQGQKLSLRLESLVQKGLVERSGDWVKLAPAKLSISNEVFVELIG